jgi:carboxyl-terminal processing protease
VAAPKLNDFEQTLMRRGVLYPFPQGVGDFIRHYLGEKPEVTKDFVVNDAVISELRKYLDEQHIKFTEADIQDNLPWLKWKIKREVFTTVFGLNEGYKVELQNDPQLEKAEEEIPQSRALYQNARKIVAERESGQTTHP